MEKKRAGRKLKCANQAEILRSHQRDDDFVKQLRERLLELLHVFGRNRNVLRILQSDVPLRLIYFIFTSGLGNQTLGEEYTGIVQAKIEARRVPSLTARTLAAILECFGERTLLRVLERLRSVVNHPHSELTPTAAAFLNSFLIKLQAVIPIFILIHKGIFYIHGRYYSLGKRIAGVDYAKVYGRRPTDGISWGLRLLGLATLAQCVLKLYQSITKEESNDKYIESNSKCTSYNCHLCLEATPTTATPCGHLFCWTCLCDWLCTKPQCPFCREYVPPSRIVYLMNL